MAVQVWGGWSRRAVGADVRAGMQGSRFFMVGRGSSRRLLALLGPVGVDALGGQFVTVTSRQGRVWIVMADAQDASREGSFYQRGNGLWVGSVWVQLPDGTLTRRHVSGRDEEATKAKWEALRAKAARGQVSAQASMSVAQYLEYWLDEVVRPLRRPATYANYAHLVRTRISPQLGKVKLERLGVADVRRWVIAMQQAGDSPRMVQVARAVLRSALTNAVAEDLLERNVAMLIRVPKPPRRAIEPWSAAGAPGRLCPREWCKATG